MGTILNYRYNKPNLAVSAAMIELKTILEIAQRIHANTSLLEYDKAKLKESVDYGVARSLSLAQSTDMDIHRVQLKNFPKLFILLLKIEGLRQLWRRCYA